MKILPADHLAAAADDEDKFGNGLWEAQPHRSCQSAATHQGLWPWVPHVGQHFPLASKTTV